MGSLPHSGSLLDILRETGLEQYYDVFYQRGLTNSARMAVLTMQEYASLGITSMEDRQRLFQLVQKLKTPTKNDREENNCKTPKTTSSFGRRKSLSASRGKLNTKHEQEGGKKEPGPKNISSLKRSKTFSGRTRTEGNTSPESEDLSDVMPGKSPKPSLSPRNHPTRRQHSFQKPNVEVSCTDFNYGVPSAIIRPSSSASNDQQCSMGPRIKVCVRKRPLSLCEKQYGEIDITEVVDNSTVVVNAPKVSVDLSKFIQQYKFVVDEALDECCTNKEVYERTAKPLIQTIFNRGKATCFAYGCTGSGKTYTMMGNDDVLGIYLLAAQDIFNMVHSESHFHGVSVHISFFEIYCGQLFDLLCGRKKVFAREDANHQVCISGLTERLVHNTEQLMEVIDYGNSVRSTGATGVNADSSRSHAIIQIELRLTGNKKLGRISFIDLAGNERAADVTDTDRQTRMEGAEINQSLLALKECIRALDLDSKHTPFRQSKLTQVLKDSFIGNCQTCMIANISPSMGSCENTLNTLRYADRVKEMKKDVSPSDFDKSEDGNQRGQEDYTLPQVESEKEVLKKSLEQLKSKIASRNNVERVSPICMTSDNRSGIPANEEAKRPATSPAENSRMSKNLSQQVPLTDRSPHSKSNRRNIPMLAPSVCRKRELLNERLRELNQDLQILPCKSLNNLLDWKSEEDLVDNSSGRNSKVSKFTCTNLTDDSSSVRQPKGTGKTMNSEYTKKKKPQGVVRPNTVHTTPLHNNGNKTNMYKQETSNGYNNRTLTQNNQNYNRRAAALSQPRNPRPNKGVRDSEDTKQYTRGRAEACLAQEQLVSAHQTQLAQVTRLCKQEMELLKDADSNRENFRDYIGQLDDILAQKMCSIATLRHMIAGFAQDEGQNHHKQSL